ncbi:MAG TPA: hypothetical protein ENG42_00705, partial [Candidatus Aenigmarchaeota archaeon]|nr:hypothetical protein [Candidatus Aenigmarchaeota archaeon]
TKNVLAQKFRKYMIPGVFTKKIFLSENEFAVVEVNGNVYEVLEKGEHVVAAMLDFRDIVVIFVDGGEKIIENNTSLRTRDNKVMIRLTIRFRIRDAKKFVRHAMGTMLMYETGDLWNKMYSEAFPAVLFSKAVLLASADFQKSDVIKNFVASVRKELESIMKGWGIELVSLSIEPAKL